MPKSAAWLSRLYLTETKSFTILEARATTKVAAYYFQPHPPRRQIALKVRQDITMLRSYRPPWALDTRGHDSQQYWEARSVMKTMGQRDVKTALQYQRPELDIVDGDESGRRFR